MKRMVLVNEREYEEWKKAPDDRLKSALFEKSQSDLRDDTLPDDIKAKQLMNDFIRYVRVQMQQPPTQPMPEWPNIIQEDKKIEIVKKEQKKKGIVRHSKRKPKPIKWDHLY